MQIELTTSPSKEDAKTISDGLVAFNHEANEGLEPHESGTEFSLFVRDEAGAVVGGLRAACFWNMLHVELVWLSREIRGSGTGTALMKKAEQFAVEHGIEQALTETTSWQARAFYEKLGYELMATLPEYPKGHSMYFMTKRLVGDTCP